MGLIDDVGRGPVGVDTVAFIYFIEAHAIYSPALRPLFAAADREELTIVTSAVTLLEVLVVPYRAGNQPLAQRYEALLTRGRGVVLREIDRPLLRAAAQLRAVFGIRTPDALQLSAALAEGCTTFVTNDRRLPALPGLRILQADNYI
jgi:predicted nucleic acid-binding protein